jgi:hypothetical protein
MGSDPSSCTAAAQGWAEVAVPVLGTGDNVLTGVSARGASDVWAVGYYVDGEEYKTLTLHYNGITWSRVPSPNGGDGTSILRASVPSHRPTRGRRASSTGPTWATTWPGPSTGRVRLERLPECDLQGGHGR